MDILNDLDLTVDRNQNNSKVFRQNQRGSQGWNTFKMNIVYHTTLLLFRKFPKTYPSTKIQTLDAFLRVANNFTKFFGVKMWGYS